MAIFAICVAGIAKRQNEINQINQRAWLGPIDWEIFERAESGSGFGRVPSSNGHSFVAFVSSTSYAIAARISWVVVESVGVVSCFMDSALT